MSKTGFYTELRPGERVDIEGGRITIRVEEKIGQKVRLHITAPSEVPIKRATSGAAQIAMKGIQVP